MSGYTQLTHEQRYHIHARVKTGQNHTQMATVIGVHKATTVGSSDGTVGCVGIGLTKPIA